MGGSTAHTALTPTEHRCRSGGPNHAGLLLAQPCRQQPRTMMLVSFEAAKMLNTSSGSTVGAPRRPNARSHQRENAASDVSTRPKMEGCLQPRSSEHCQGEHATGMHRPEGTNTAGRGAAHLDGKLSMRAMPSRQLCETDRRTSLSKAAPWRAGDMLQRYPHSICGARPSSTRACQPERMFRGL